MKPLRFTQSLILVSFSVCWAQNNSGQNTGIAELITKAEEYINHGQMTEALKFIVTADSMTQYSIGRQTDNYARLCLDYGLIYANSITTKNEDYLLLARTLYEKLGLTQEQSYSRTLIALGSHYLKKPNPEKGEYFLFKAIQKALQCSEVNRRKISNLFFQSGVNELNNGYYEAAFKILNLTDSLHLLNHKDSSSAYPEFLTKVGNLFYQKGKYKYSEYFLLKARANYESINKSSWEAFSVCLESIGNLYFKLGNYAFAKAHYKEAMELRKTKCPSGSQYARILTSLGNVHLKEKKYTDAESYYIGANAILKVDSARSFEDYTTGLNNLGVLYNTTGQTDKALISFNEVLNLIKSQTPFDPMGYSSALYNLGHLYFQNRKFDLAEKYVSESVSIRASYPNRQLTNYAQSIRLLAQIYELNGKHSGTYKLLSEYFDLKNKEVSDVANFLTESELSKFNSSSEKDGYLLCSIIKNRIEKAKINDGLVSMLYDQVLNQKGFLTHQVQKKFTRVNASPQQKILADQLRNVRWELSNEYTKLSVDQDSSRLENLEKMSMQLEKELVINADSASSYGWLSWKDIKSLLTQNEAAVEFIHYYKVFPSRSDSIFYAALVLSKNDHTTDDAVPIFIPLFEQHELNKLERDISGRNIPSLLYQNSAGTDSLAFKENDAYSFIWKKIIDTIGLATTIYYSPSADLNRMNLDALLASNNLKKKDNTIKSIKTIRLFSTRDLLNNKSGSGKFKEAYIYGGINYSRDTVPKNPNIGVGIDSRGIDSEHLMDSVNSIHPWRFLSESEKEANLVASLLQTDSIRVNLFMGSEATEESFKHIGDGGLPAPDIIHIATHGFFFPDNDGNQRSEQDDLDEPPLARLNNQPMLRSGLIMAGGNSRWSGEKLNAGMEDGILTSYEIAEMDLSNTSLVVLSACETGLGEIQGYEGVYGLQRAFRIAGAHNIIMSLWQVDDESSRMLMAEFYKNLILSDFPINQALKLAQEKIRSNKRFQDPYYWAGWVLLE